MTGHDRRRRATEILAAALMRLLVPAALAVLGLAGVWAIGDTVLSGSPVPRNPGFLDSLFASGAVLAATRLAIIAAAGWESSTCCPGGPAAVASPGGAGGGVGAGWRSGERKRVAAGHAHDSASQSG